MAETMKLVSLHDNLSDSMILKTTGITALGIGLLVLAGMGVYYTWEHIEKKRR
jgi:hypothetical protein